MTPIKVKIPKGHESLKGAKVGDRMVMKGPVTSIDDDEGAECEMGQCEKDTAPATGKKTKMKPGEYLKQKRREQAEGE